MKSNFNVHRSDDPRAKIIKHWTRGVGIENAALGQLENLSLMPFIHSHIAAMPDVHFGFGSTVGSVIATNKALIPAAIGVDIGCGMIAQKTSLRAEDLPDSLLDIRLDIERAVPHGFVTTPGRALKGAFLISPNSHVSQYRPLYDRYEKLIDKNPAINHKNAHLQLGTLGGGNHFIEVCLDEDDYVWVMLHSGSRGVGNAIGRHFIDLAKKDMERHYIQLPDKDLAYLVEGTDHFDDYVEALSWAQDYAIVNREVMMQSVISVLRKHLKAFNFSSKAVNCHHNYASMENHFGQNVWLTRKGAVRAREGDLGIIPGSMGTGSFIVEGLGNKESFCSCSHGAGRVMSRSKAKELITMGEHKKAMQGIESRIDVSLLDESPAAYKDIGAVMDAQSDLVKVKHRLRQVINVKG